jgi:hypothetical protein
MFLPTYFDGLYYVQYSSNNSEIGLSHNIGGKYCNKIPYNRQHEQSIRLKTTARGWNAAWHHFSSRDRKRWQLLATLRPAPRRPRL